MHTPPAVAVAAPVKGSSNCSRYATHVRKMKMPFLERVSGVVLVRIFKEMLRVAKQFEVNPALVYCRTE